MTEPTKTDYEVLIVVLEGLKARRNLQDMRIAKEQAEGETYQWRDMVEKLQGELEVLEAEMNSLKEVVQGIKELAELYGWGDEPTLLTPKEFLSQLLESAPLQ